MADLAIEGLAKAFDGVPVLRGVDLRVAAGRLVAILGRSGSGKTTLLRLVCGFERADAGRIAIGGQTVSGAGVMLPPEQRRIGYVAQEGALFPHLTVADNVLFGLPRAARRDRARAGELLELVGLPSAYAARWPHELSGGEQQRVALARALAPAPRLVLLDEPFSSLDAALRVETREAVAAALERAGATALLVTHDQAEALSLGQEVAVLRDGRMVQVGPPTELYHRPVDAELARFVGEAVLLPGEAACGQVRCALGLLPLAAGMAQGTVAVMLRPEQLQLARPWRAPLPEARVLGVSFYGPGARVRLALAGEGGGETLLARVPGHMAPEPGECVGVIVTGEAASFPAAADPGRAAAAELAPPPRRRGLALLAAGLLLLAAGGARAQGTASPQQQQTPTPGPTGQAGKQGGGGLFSDSRDTLLGDAFGLRPALDALGLSFGLQETSEVLANPTGGVRRGADYDGLTEMSLGLDTGKAFGWPGGVFNMSALQIHGRFISETNLLVLQEATDLEAQRATRLWELWYQQTLLHGALDIKIGQQAADQEFLINPYAAVFLNSAMGWPVLTSLDLYAGGPDYPLASLGLRLRARPTESLTLLGGVFDDNPPGGPFENDEQTRGREAAGLAFNLNTGALWIAEVQYAINQPRSGGVGPPPAGLPGSYKLGAWYDSGTFPDQRYDTSGLPLASPASSGMPRKHHGNYSFYALADQTVWQPDPNGARALGLFARVMAAPPDRNFISVSADGGVTLKAPFAGRDNDTFGIGWGVAKIGGAARAHDRDTASFSGESVPARTAETFIEVTYQLQLAGWWQVQPDMQYFFRPGGGIPDPSQPGKLVGNALVLGLRTNVVF